MKVRFAWKYERQPCGRMAWIGRALEPRGLEARAVVTDWRLEGCWDQRLEVGEATVKSGAGRYCMTAQGGKRRAAFMLRRYLEGMEHDSAMTTTGIRVSKALLQRLRRRANREGVCPSVIWRRAIRAELERLEQD